MSELKDKVVALTEIANILSALEKEKAVFEKDIASLTKQRVSLEEAIDGSRSQLQELNTNRANTVAEAEKGLKSVQTTKDDLTQQIAQMETVITSHQQEAKRLEQVIAALNTDISSQTARLQLEVDSKRSEVAELNKVLDDKNDTIAALRGDIEQLVSNKQQVADEAEVIKQTVVVARENHQKVLEEFALEYQRLEKAAEDQRNTNRELKSIQQKGLTELVKKQQTLGEYEEGLKRLEQSLKIKFDVLEKEKIDIRTQRRRLNSIEHLSSI
jgi:chromosome segregation ATPase